MPVADQKKRLVSATIVIYAGALRQQNDFSVSLRVFGGSSCPVTTLQNLTKRNCEDKNNAGKGEEGVRGGGEADQHSYNSTLAHVSAKKK